MASRLNVVLAPGSPAHRSYRQPAPQASARPDVTSLAPGFTPQPAWNLIPQGGRTIPHLSFVNCYVGAAGAWDGADRERIDGALQAALTDERLQGVIAQYYPGEEISSTMLPSSVHELALDATVYKDTVEQIATTLHEQNVLGEVAPSESVINIMLPKGVVLSTERAGAGAPEAIGGEAAESAGEPARVAAQRAPGAGDLDEEGAVESSEGLGGYHGSIDLPGGERIYYACGVYSFEEDGVRNGIPFFDEPWKNVVATFYHELNEARTDPDVEEADVRRDDALLGWYSLHGRGEIGDLPMSACGADLGLVMQEVALADGAGKVPIQLMWSNEADGPAAGV